MARKFPKWLSKEAGLILKQLRVDYPNADHDELAVLADQWSIYQSASASINRQDIASTKQFCDIADKALKAIRIIEKKLVKGSNEESRVF